MHNPLFSIIVPTHNSEKTVMFSIQSIINQSFTSFEILIIDNLSRDQTLEIVKSFNDDRIKIISEADTGVYDAMNKGIDQASGEWLYFLGSDDVLNDMNVLADVNKFIIQKSGNVVYGNVYFKNNARIFGEESSIEKLLLVENICHQAIFYNKEVFKILGMYNLKYPIWADWDFNIRCFKHPDFVINYFNRTIAIYNDFGGLSANQDEVLKRQLPVFYIKERDELKDKINKVKRKLSVFPYIAFNLRKILK